MIPSIEWFCKLGRHDGGDFFLGDDSTTRITWWGKFNLMLKGERVRTLPSGLHILGMDRTIISINKMSDVGVTTMFERKRIGWFKEQWSY